MSTEREISGGRIAAVLDEEALIGALHEYRRCSEDQARGIIVAYLAIAHREDSLMALVEVKLDLEKQVRELMHHLDIALEHEVACAEQRQRADMAEEREKKLREALKFYADKDNYLDGGYIGEYRVPSYIETDEGALAVEALSAS